MADITAIVVAAGKGVRMRFAENKVFLPLLGVPVLQHTLGQFELAERINKILLVAARGEEQRCREIVNRAGFKKDINIVTGGPRRQDSVWAGLKELDDTASLVVVHDGARPLFTAGLLQECIEQAEKHHAAIAAVRVKDTIKVGDGQQFVRETPDRKDLWAVQTPQVFDKELLLRAYHYSRENGIDVTDDAAMVEKIGARVKIVPGEYENLKLTTPEDLLMAEAVLQRRQTICE